MSWKNDRLGNYSKVISGYAFKSDSFRTDNGIPIIKIKNIQREYVDIDGEYFVDTSYLSLDPKFHCIKDDILISLTGSHITLPNSVVGRVAKYHYDFTSLLNQRGGKIVVTNPDKLENNYLYYYLCQNEIRIKLAQFGRGGANQCNISPSNVESIPIILPPLETQKRIASILSAYDDLIENNLKRITLLEETAQNIYKQWFVNFRFPYYEHTEFDEESGLPVGWEKIQVRDYVSIISKGPSLNYEGDGIKFPVLNQSCIRNGEIQLEKVLNANELSTNKDYCYLNINDILINSMGQGTLGRVSKNVSIYEKFIIHNCITFLRAKPELSQYQLFYFISSNQKYFESVGQGSTGQTTLKVSLIEELEINKPTNTIIRNFDLLIAPIWKQIGILKNQNQKLKDARDILLPRLMNRTIEV